MADAPKGRSGKTVAPDYFRTLYREVEDPWDYACSAYEAEKYARSLAALPRARYGSALELGCSVGVFTRALARRCTRLLAADVSPAALERARARCAELPNVRFEECDLTRSFPAGTFDAIAFCELGFYFGPRDLERIRNNIARGIRPGGDLLLVHWTPLVAGHAQTAGDVHDAFAADARFSVERAISYPTYRLDVLRRSRFPVA